MEEQEAVDFVGQDPHRESFEKEFHVGFAKGDEGMTVSSSIKSMTKRLLSHSDVSVKSVCVYDESSDSYRDVHISDFDGEGKIVSGVFDAPVGLLKLGSTPRKTKSYAQVISPQEEVNFD